MEDPFAVAAVHATVRLLTVREESVGAPGALGGFEAGVAVLMDVGLL
jgi:hypothetical protein